MTEPYLSLGLACVGAVATFGAFEVYDAYRYRDHPTESPLTEAIHWGTVLALWIGAVALVALT